MRDVQAVLSRLNQSPFRSQIRLGPREREYLLRKGMSEVLQHAAEFVEKRLAPAYPANDGKQTPWHNHPVYVAQHTTATCCRGVYISGTRFRRKERSQHRVRPNPPFGEHQAHYGGCERSRVFKQFSRLEVDATKAALSRPTDQRVTRAVGQLSRQTNP